MFLLNLQHVLFDPTDIPAPPNQPWQGTINQIRFDPLVRFYGQLGAPADGWFEVDRITPIP